MPNCFLINVYINIPQAHYSVDDDEKSRDTKSATGASFYLTTHGETWWCGGSVLDCPVYQQGYSVGLCKSPSYYDIRGIL